MGVPSQTVGSRESEAAPPRLHDHSNGHAAGRAEAAASYDSIADWYAGFVRAGSPIHDVVLPCVLELSGAVEDLRICDLGCGEGIVARMLADAGASVVGVDISPSLLLLADAQERLEPRGIAYVLDDAERLLRLDGECFDGVVSNLALTDITELASAVHAVARVLRPGGFFVFSVNHPCGPVSAGGGQLLHAARDYFSEGYWRTPNPDSVRGRVGAYHRMLSTYLNTLCEAGLSLEACVEPRAGSALASYVPGYERVPVALVLRCRKPA